MLAVANCVPMRYMGSYKEEPMASTERVVTIRYIVVSIEHGELLVHRNLYSALEDCDKMTNSYVRREITVEWDNVKVISKSTVHANKIDIVA